MDSFRKKLFTYRGYTPIPFLIVMFIFAHPTTISVIIGFIFVLSGELIRIWGVSYIGSLARVTGSVGAPRVVVAGPYSYVRNPLYLGNIITYVGIGIMSNALFPWLIFLALLWFVFQYYQIVLLEESFLEKEFSNEYAQYKKNVPRFIPRLTRYVDTAQEMQKPNWKEAIHSEQRTIQALILVVATIIVLWYLR